MLKQKPEARFDPERIKKKKPRRCGPMDGMLPQVINQGRRPPLGNEAFYPSQPLLGCGKTCFKTLAAVTAIFLWFCGPDGFQHRGDDLTKCGWITLVAGIGAKCRTRPIFRSRPMIGQFFKRLIALGKEQGDGIDKTHPFCRQHQLNGIEVFPATKTAGKICGFVDGCVMTAAQWAIEAWTLPVSGIGRPDHCWDQGFDRDRIAQVSSLKQMSCRVVSTVARN